MANSPKNEQIFVFSKKGDAGETSLLSGERIPKSHLRPETYGTLDEASAALGLAKSITGIKKVKEMIQVIQEDLVILGAELAWTKEEPKYRIETNHIKKLEAWIEELQKEVPLPRHFIYPGDSTSGATVDLARTIIRRAERRAVELKNSGEINRSEILSYLNRLADFLFTLARYLDSKESKTNNPF